MSDMRLIDAEALINVLCARLCSIDNGRTMRQAAIPVADGMRIMELEYCIGLIQCADIIDAVPVVRCKDCVGSSLWNDKLICERISNAMDGYYHGTVEVVNPDDYCSRGIRQTAKPCGAMMDGGAEG